MDPASIASLLSERLEELSALPLDYQSREYKEWNQKALVTLRRCLGENSKAVEEFEEIGFFPTTVSLRGRTDYATPFERGRREAAGLLKALIYEYEELVPTESAAGRDSVDPELWAEVAHLVEGEQWPQVASQTAIFTESKIREWTGSGDSDIGQQLINVALHPSTGMLTLGRTNGEKEGWHRFGLGIVGALGNVDRHRIQNRPDLKRYALGVLGAASLLLTQLRYEHGNRFMSD